MFNKPPDMSLRKIERILLLNAQRRPAVLGVGKRWYTADRGRDPESTTPEVLVQCLRYALQRFL